MSKQREDMKETVIGGVCRICLDTGPVTHMVDIFSSRPPNTQTYDIMMASLGNIPVNENDGLPKQMCNDCRAKLQLCFEFKESLIRNFKILCEMVATKLKPTSSHFENSRSNFELENTDLVSNSVPSSQEKDCSGMVQTAVIKTTVKQKSEDKLLFLLQKLHKNRNKCPLCLQTVHENETVRDHFYSHYKYTDLTPLIADGKKTKLCNLCNKTINKYYVMVLHHRSHLKIYPYKCEIHNCNKGFISEQYRLLHKDRHSGLKKYQCKSCGKTFGLRSSLKNHEETHKSDSPQCKICHKVSKNFNTLKIHMKRHENGLKYKCKQVGCEKSFHLVQELNRHLKTHSSEKNHICEVCHKAFCSITALKRHCRYHMIVRQHQCSICPKSFVETTQLRLHEMAHRGERPHACELCSSKFITKSKLKRHQMNSCKSTGS